MVRLPTCMEQMQAKCLWYFHSAFILLLVSKTWSASTGRINILLKVFFKEIAVMLQYTQPLASNCLCSVSLVSLENLLAAGACLCIYSMYVYEQQTHETHSNILHRPHQAAERKGQHPFFFLVYITKQKKTTHTFPFTK